METARSLICFWISLSVLSISCSCTAVPNVIIHDSNSIVDYGKQFTINCTVTGNPPATNVYWERKSYGFTTRLDSGLGGTSGMTVEEPSLTISFASMTDSGIYSCVASNSVGTGYSRTVNITIYGGLPVIGTPSKFYTVNYGGYITINCSVDAFPKLNLVNWQKNCSGELIILNAGAVGTAGMTPKTPSLTLKSARLSDSGIYICSATNIAGTSRSEEIVLSVTGDLPVVTVSKVDYTVDYGMTVVIQCTVFADPAATEIFWEKYNNGVKSIICSNTDGIFGSTISSPSLKIVNATIADSGDYECFAKNKIGVGKSQPTRLNVLGAIPIVRVGALAYSVEYGRKHTLNCTVAAKPEYSVVYWEKNSNGLASTITSMAVGTSGITIDTPSLTFEFTKLSDSGNYTCYAANAVGIGSSQTTELTVKGDTPSVAVSQHQYIATFGEEITLSCEVASNPQHTFVYWERSVKGTVYVLTTELSGIDGVTVNNPSLTIKHVTTSDSGIYQCFAVNDIGIGKSQTSNLTIVAEVPFVTIRNLSYTVAAGSNLEISCKVNSVPRHNYVYWEKAENGTFRVIIRGVVGFDGITVDNPSLFIPKVNILMNGQYRCIATNAVGTGSSMYTTLIVVPGEGLMNSSTTNVETSSQHETTPYKRTSSVHTKELSTATKEQSAITAVTSDLIEVTDSRIDTTYSNYNSTMQADTEKATASHSVAFEANKEDSPGKIAGIAIGCTLGFAIIVIVIVLVCRHYKRKQKSQAEEEQTRHFNIGETEYGQDIHLERPLRLPPLSCIDINCAASMQYNDNYDDSSSVQDHKQMISSYPNSRYSCIKCSKCGKVHPSSDDCNAYMNTSNF